MKAMERSWEKSDKLQTNTDNSIKFFLLFMEVE